jgi:SAM-dependent methyltransferase
VADDPAYAEDIVPLALDLIDTPASLLDLGCGEGQLMRALPPGVRAVGCDLSRSLLAVARGSGAAVCARLPDLGWLRSGTFDAAVAVLVVEHLDDVDGLFAEAARVVKPGGRLAVVMNHPAYTAAGAGPVVDQSDGEVLWRWGPYFDAGSSLEPAGDLEVRFRHRPLGSLLEPAARHGWHLERFVERGLGPAAVARHPSLHGQEHFPRLLGMVWRTTQGIEPTRG